ncbi:hypothetical protein CHGG_04056 [Chaetomium globosum CBS 148.51]|uniref:RecF/RecN/SMC N-terminal domain-containing protein n=1 Tax=Chaetomium globosum (strain ATCC 6205 / CBS 148.51 / DSM 1962 / NBRC 6347 / NRRL 1970) TaxID=306901 RepID=Q2H2E0_CHAGB|nr:uncharacterized protein CHGG_04056 [Chaetomium globosum CBS 148.51]EAQ87437.1 hypothetical protein CHGG_04056 [Chaetomium globosum CBS 148.51]
MTVVLSHESAASFLSATPAQRRDLIEASLGLSLLDQCEQIAKLSLKDIDAQLAKIKGKLDTQDWKIKDNKRRFENLQKEHTKLEREAQEAVTSFEVAMRNHERKEDQTPDPEMGSRDNIARLEDQIDTEQENLQRLEISCARMQEQKPAEPAPVPASWLSRLQHQLSQTIEAMAAARPRGLRKFFHVAETFILRFLVQTVRSLRRISGDPDDASPETSSAQSHDQELQKVAVENIRRDLQRSRSRLQSLKHEKRLAIDHAVTISERAQRAMQAQKRVQALQHQVTIKQQKADTYKPLVENEQSSLHSLRSERESLASKHQELTADRELFAFWSSSMAKQTSRASSSSKKNLKKAPNFREHILTNSTSDLNALVTEALAVLYHDTRHTHGLATGMLRTLFTDPDDPTITTTSTSRPADRVLDPTLAVNPSLAYHKRSSGERKRVLLALFFALLQLARARSAHRAHYVLVDEVFDNLDRAGQTAVVRWCDVMSRAGVVGWIVVITHSAFLAERDFSAPGEEGGRALVVGVRMGERGTVLEVEGRRVGAG